MDATLDFGVVILIMLGTLLLIFLAGRKAQPSAAPNHGASRYDETDRLRAEESIAALAECDCERCTMLRTVLLRPEEWAVYRLGMTTMLSVAARVRGLDDIGDKMQRKASHYAVEAEALVMCVARKDVL